MTRIRRSFFPLHVMSVLAGAVGMTAGLIGPTMATDNHLVISPSTSEVVLGNKVGFDLTALQDFGITSARDARDVDKWHFGDMTDAIDKLDTGGVPGAALEVAAVGNGGSADNWPIGLVVATLTPERSGEGLYGPREIVRS